MPALLQMILDPFRSRRVQAGLGVVTVVSILSGIAASQGLGKLLALPEDAEIEEIEMVANAADEEDETARKSRASTPSARSKDFYNRPILDRNLFDPDAVAVVESVDTEGGRPTDLDVRLLATVVAIPSDSSSALIVEDKRGARARGYGVGYSLLGEGTIHAIEKKRVVILRNSGDIEYLDMSEEKGKSKPARAKGSDGEQVERDGDNFTVDRTLLDEAMENMDKLATQVRVVPHKGPGGEVDGYRLSAIRRGTLFDKLGIKNGDIVHNVNGQSLSSTSDAMNAYQGLQNESAFSFEITRRNKKKTLSYQIR